MSDCLFLVLLEIILSAYLPPICNELPGTVKSLLWENRKKQNRVVTLAPSCSPHTQKFGLLPRGRRLGLHFQRVNVGDGDDGGSNVPWQAHERADDHQDGHPEQVQVIACPFLKGDVRRECRIMREAPGMKTGGHS